MRELYTQQLTTMKTRLIQMGAMCEDAISCSVKGMLHGDAELLKKVESTEMDINQMERLPVRRSDHRRGRRECHKIANQFVLWFEDMV